MRPARAVACRHASHVNPSGGGARGGCGLAFLGGGAGRAALAGLWLAARVSFLVPIPAIAAIADLGFGAALIALVAREVASARNFHNYPIVVVLAVLLTGNVLVHLQAFELAYTAALGNRIGVATLLALIALIGGRIIPSFTRNWLAK